MFRVGENIIMSNIFHETRPLRVKMVWNRISSASIINLSLMSIRSCNLSREFQNVRGIEADITNRQMDKVINRRHYVKRRFISRVSTFTFRFRLRKQNRIRKIFPFRYRKRAPYNWTRHVCVYYWISSVHKSFTIRYLSKKQPVDSIIVEA